MATPGPPHVEGQEGQPTTAQNTQNNEVPQLQRVQGSSTGLASLKDDGSTLAPSTFQSSLSDSSSNTKAKHGKPFGAYHHKQRHVHTPHHPAHHKHYTHATHSDLELQPLVHDEELWDEPTRYVTSHELGFSLFGYRFNWSGVRCIRSVRLKLTQTNEAGETEEWEATGHWSAIGMFFKKKKYLDELKMQERYLVVGRMAKNGNVVMEKLVRYPGGNEEEMMKRLRKAVKQVRGMRGLVSLKKISGFGLYQCDTSAGHHTRVHLTEHQRSLLRNFYSSFSARSEYDAPEFLWDDWVFKHLSASSKDPTEGKYSIDVLLSWSVLRLGIATSLPVLLSLAVGLWYQTKPAEDGSDPVGTAWILATYIITAGALIIAFLGVATGLEQS